MDTITFQVDEAIALALAVAQGWSPQVEDTSQPLEGDNYPLIPNPVTYQRYVAGIAGKFLTDHVLRAGRQRVINDFQSIFNNVEAQVTSGTFDQLILQGNIDGIRDLVKSSLS